MPQNRIREVRMQKGLSLRKLAKITGIPLMPLSYLERGMWPHWPGYIKRIAEALGVSEEELLVKDEEKSEVKT